MIEQTVSIVEQQLRIRRERAESSSKYDFLLLSRRREARSKIVVPRGVAALHETRRRIDNGRDRAGRASVRRDTKGRFYP